MHLDENRVVWMEIRSACKGLLNSKDYERYRELNDRHVFTDAGDENRLDQWDAFLEIDVLGDGGARRCPGNGLWS